MRLWYWVIEYVITLIEVFLCFQFSNEFVKINDEKVKKRFFIYAIVYSILTIVINRIELFSYANGIIGVVTLFILQAIIYRKKYGLIFLLTTLYAVIASAVDFSFAQMGAIAFNVNKQYILQVQSIERCICMVVSKLFLFVIVYFFCKYSNNRAELPRKYIVANCVISIILISLDYYIIGNDSIAESVELRKFSILFFVLSIAFIILIFGFVLNLSQIYKLKEDVALLRLHNEMIYKSEKNTEKVFNMWRSSIHDYKHKIFAIKRWLDVGDNEKIRKFINEENLLMQQKIFYIKTGNDIIDAIVNTKRSLAEEKGIIFTTNISLPGECVISDLDIVCILGNLIDNAIDACADQDVKYIDLIIKEVKKMIIIKLTNAYKEDKNGNDESNKDETYMHGIGLKNIKSIVNKYAGTYKMTREQDEVVSIIMILNK